MLPTKPLNMIIEGNIFISPIDTTGCGAILGHPLILILYFDSILYHFILFLNQHRPTRTSICLFDCTRNSLKLGKCKLRISPGSTFGNSGDNAEKQFTNFLFKYEKRVSTLFLEQKILLKKKMHLR